MGKKKSSVDKKGSKMADEDNTEQQQKRRNNDIPEIDPDGTLNVARGHDKDDVPTKDEIMEKVNDKHKEQVNNLLNTSKERLDLLRKDDENPNLLSLNDKQKRSYEYRRKNKNKKTTHILERYESKRIKATVNQVQAIDILQNQEQTVGYLVPENDMERTSAYTQTQIKRQSKNSAKNVYDLQLFGPSRICYDRSGQYTLLTSNNGQQIGLIENNNRSLITEFALPNEKIQDATFLHNHTLYALAQRDYAYIYDTNGVEIHCLDHSFRQPKHLQFLPYHWLLVGTCTSKGQRKPILVYQDTSTGEIVSTHRTPLTNTAMTQNPSNAIIHVGHTNGTVTLWSPASNTYLANINCHKGSVITDISVDENVMVTSGMDKYVRIWDLRNYKLRYQYEVRAGVPTSIDISQRGLLGIGHAGHVTIWGNIHDSNKHISPYMHHQLGPAGNNTGKGPVENVQFRPYDDVLGIGHANGISSIVIPGSGDPSMDTAEIVTDTKQRREREVKSLLEKLSPNMITLDTTNTTIVGGIEPSDPHTRYERTYDIQQEANNKILPIKKKEKNKKRGQSKIQTKLRRKHKNIIDEQTIKLKEAREKEILIEKQQQKEAATNVEGQQDEDSATAPTALKRFF